LNSRAAAPEEVKIAAPLPKAERLAASIAASRSSIRITLRTGPKTSSRAIVIESITLSRTVAPR
jgi:hypothetical protein